ncbi:CCDC138 [Bugula neritina]|uniref:CCDC138 n=1 Tax=Bugula neritina TaxID=10212 RepID=A0A7J7J4N0_BUGNE|nr:CCDC138 [Bugula neritina]
MAKQDEFDFSTSFNEYADVYDEVEEYLYEERGSGHGDENCSYGSVTCEGDSPATKKEYAHSGELSTLHDGAPVNKSSNMASDETIRTMYQELQLISAQLKTKNLELSQKEKQLSDRELRLNIREEELELAYKKLVFNLHEAVDTEVSEKHKKVSERLADYQTQVKDKTKENRRLRANFDSLQEANSLLRKQCEGLQSRNGKLEKQLQSLKQRLENLQRCQELRERQTENIVAEMKAAPPVKSAKPVKVSKSYTSIQGSSSDVFSILLDWTIKDILKPSFERGKNLDGSLRVHILENCQQMLPFLVEIIREQSTESHAKFTLPCLQFIYWSCLLLDHNPGKQSVGLGGVQRKLAEELYRPLRPDENVEMTLASQVFVKSSDTQIRLLSTLLLLRTLTQADCVAKVFSILKHDLRDDLMKELFVGYHGTSVLLSYFKPTCKAQLPVVLDIYILMCVETAVLQPFLAFCSTEAWFRAVSMVLKIPSLDIKQHEKLSVILQKLSKIRDNRKYFDQFSLKSLIRDLLQSTPSHENNSFLVLNLKSVLFNLGSPTTLAG